MDQEMTKATELERSLRTDLAKLKSQFDAISTDHTSLKAKYNTEFSQANESKL